MIAFRPKNFQFEVEREKEKKGGAVGCYSLKANSFSEKILLYYCNCSMQQAHLQDLLK